MDSQPRAAPTCLPEERAWKELTSQPVHRGGKAGMKGWEPQRVTPASSHCPRRSHGCSSRVCVTAGSLVALTCIFSLPSLRTCLKPISDTDRFSRWGSHPWLGSDSRGHLSCGVRGEAGNTCRLEDTSLCLTRTKSCYCGVGVGVGWVSSGAPAAAGTPGLLSACR